MDKQKVLELLYRWDQSERDGTAKLSKWMEAFGRDAHEVLYYVRHGTWRTPEPVSLWEEVRRAFRRSPTPLPKFKVATLHLLGGDKAVLETEQVMSYEDMERLKSEWEKALRGDAHAIVLSGGVRLAAVVCNHVKKTDLPDPQNG